MCKAGGVSNFAKLGLDTEHPNYGKPCVPVEGQYDSLPMLSCLYCGKDLGRVGSERLTSLRGGIPGAADEALASPIKDV